MKKLRGMGFFFLSFAFLFSQETVGNLNLTLSFQTPEASLFFMNPSYLNPAEAKGVRGIFANPSSLGSSGGLETSFAFSLPKTVTFDFDWVASEASQTHEALLIPVKGQLTEKGGVNFFGLAKSFGILGFGFGFMQGSALSLGFDASGKVNLSESFEIDDSLSFPIDETDTTIPIRWTVDTKIDLSLEGDGEIGVSSSPLFFGMGAGFGPISLGAGLKLNKYESIGGNPHILTPVTGEIHLTGIPQGGWSGLVEASGTIVDTPYKMNLDWSLEGKRWALTLGGTINLGIFKLGVAYEKGFKTSLDGKYRYELISTTGNPSDVTLENFQLDSVNIQTGEVYGNAQLSFGNFSKDTTISLREGGFELNGYNTVSLGLGLSVFNIFGGVTIPSNQPEVASLWGGVYFSFPIFLVGSMRAGLLARVDAIKTESGNFIPTRGLAHIGLGASFSTQLKTLGPAIGVPLTIDVGIKTSALPILLGILNIEDLENFEKPGIFSGLTLSLGASLSL